MAFIYDLTDTWNAGGTTFNAIKMNVTDSASAAASKLVTLQVGGSERFGVRKDGQGYFAGNVGIGTSSPAVKLHVSATAPTVLIEGSANSDAGVQTKTPLADFKFGAGIGSATNCWNVYDLAANAERLRIDSAGNVGIGTSSPGARLETSVTSNGATAEVLRLSNAGVGANTQAQINFLAASTSYGTITSGFGAAAPQMVFNLPSVSAGNYIWQISNTERMRIDSSGNLGIGTSSPAQRLTVSQNGGTNVIALVEQLDSSGGTSAQFVGTHGSGTQARFQVGSGFCTTGTATADPFVFITNNTERARIDSSGNVGIGTSSPAARLSVATNTATAGMEESFSITNTVDSNVFIRVSGTANGDKKATIGPSTSTALVFNTADTERMRITSAGNTVIADGKFLSWGNEAQGFLGENAGGSLRAYTGYNERMRITSAGNVGIGTSGPVWKLEVVGGSTDKLRLYNTVGNGNTIDFLDQAWQSQIVGNAGNLLFKTGGTTERMRIDSSGNLLVGKTASSGGTAGFEATASGFASTASGTFAGWMNRTTSDGDILRFNRDATLVGSVSVTTTATTYNTSSDYRLKDIDGPIQNSGAYIDALKPVQGSWKADGSRFIGLLAHEVQEVSETQIATGEKDGEEMQAMDYSAPEIIANLIAEIQSLRVRVAQLEGN